MEDEIRLDVLVARQLDISRERAKKLIKKGAITVDGEKKKKPSKNVLESAEVICLSDLGEDAGEADKPYEKVEPQKIDFGVIYEDDDILVVDKPDGLVVHPACKNLDNTLLNGLYWYFEQKGHKQKPRLVHRLDKDTSGVLIVAKGEAAHAMLAKQFEERKTKKIYDAIVTGDFRVPSFSDETKKAKGLLLEEQGGWVRFGCYLARAKADRRKVQVVTERAGKWALSEFKVHKKLGNATWLNVKIITGRTHQIRAQLKFLGFPVVGDLVYGGARDGKKVTNMLLHATSLEILVPSDDKMTFESKIPKEFLQYGKEK